MPTSFSIHDVYDLSRPVLVPTGFVGRELAAVEEASTLGPVPARFLAGLSQPVLREFLRRTLLRVRTQGELDRLRARYAEFAPYFPSRPGSEAA